MLKAIGQKYQIAFLPEFYFFKGLHKKRRSSMGTFLCNTFGITYLPEDSRLPPMSPLLLCSLRPLSGDGLVLFDFSSPMAPFRLVSDSWPRFFFVLGIVLNLSESTILWNNRNSVKNMPEQTL